MNYHYIEIAYCDKDEGYIFGLRTEAKSIGEILQMCKIERNDCVIGIKGELVDEDTVIDQDCRIELFPPLRIDPIEKRKRLVETRRKKRN